MKSFLFRVTKSFFSLSFSFLKSTFPNHLYNQNWGIDIWKTFHQRDGCPIHEYSISELFIVEVLRMFAAICASIFFSSDFFLFFSFLFFFLKWGASRASLCLFSAKRKKREREKYHEHWNKIFFSVSCTSSVHFYWVFYKNLFLSSLTIENPQENLWSISRKQRPWQAAEQHNPTVGKLGRNPSLSMPKNNTVC